MDVFVFHYNMSIICPQRKSIFLPKKDTFWWNYLSTEKFGILKARNRLAKGSQFWPQMLDILKNLPKSFKRTFLEAPTIQIMIPRYWGVLKLVVKCFLVLSNCFRVSEVGLTVFCQSMSLADVSVTDPV